MTKVYCDVCGKFISKFDVFKTDFFNVKYEVCEKHYREMYKYHNELKKKMKNEFETKFSKKIVE